jgi:hypothetical protein
MEFEKKYQQLLRDNLFAQATTYCLASFLFITAADLAKDGASISYEISWTSLSIPVFEFPYWVPTAFYYFCLPISILLGVAAFSSRICEVIRIEQIVRILSSVFAVVVLAGFAVAWQQGLILVARHPILFSVFFVGGLVGFVAIVIRLIPSRPGKDP